MQSDPYRVLVVDDEPSVCEAIKMVLWRCGCQVVVAHNAVEALTACQTTSFHLAIVDEMMPGIKGNELAAILKKDHPASRILMISAFQLRKPFRTLDFLLKPFTPQALWEAAFKLMGSGAGPFCCPSPTGNPAAIGA